MMRKKTKFDICSPGRRRGFAILEILVAMAMTTVIMTSVLLIFTRGIFSYRVVREVQRNMEEAQQTLNLMAKTIRTSKIITNNNNNCTSLCTEIKIYNFSQDRCIVYKFDSGKLKAAYLYVNPVNTPDYDERITKCEDFNPSDADFFNMTSCEVAGKFLAIPSASETKIAGRVTIAIDVCPPGKCNDNPIARTTMQTTVSLRNY